MASRPRRSLLPADTPRTAPAVRGAIRSWAAPLTAAIAASVLLIAAPVASAEHTFGAFGSEAGQTDKPAGIGTDASGNVYVADRGNDRIDVFESDGDFVRAFGWGVDTGAAQLEVCTTASGCNAGIAGSGSGQLSNPEALVVDSAGNIYVVDDNLRVQKFSSTGTFILMFGGDVNQTTGGDICTAASGNTCGVGVAGPNCGEGRLKNAGGPIALGPGGTVYVGDNHSEPGNQYSSCVERFDASGVFLGHVQLPGIRRLTDLAIDSSGNLYVARSGEEGGLRKHDASGALVEVADADTETRALAIDSADKLFAAQWEGGVFRVVAEYNVGGPAISTLSRFGYGLIDRHLRGLAFDLSNAGIFGSEENEGGSSAGNRIIHIPFPPPGPIIAPGPVATAVGNAKATLNARINPEGKETTYRFEYVDEESFEDEGFSSPAKKEKEGVFTGELVTGSEGFRLHPASAVVGCPDPLTELAEGKCLLPETVYHFRVFAENADGNGNSPVEGGTFETKPPLEIKGTWSTEVGTDSATIRAAINPLGIPASGHFEYVDDATYQEGVTESGDGFAEAEETAEIDFGSGEAPQVGGAFLHPLQLHTTYHYRVIADDPLIEPILGPERTFTTGTIPPPLPNPDPCPNAQFRTGASAYLPDCRAYEMVSPVDKDNGDIVALGNILNSPATLNMSASSGLKLTYGTYRAFGDAQSAPYTSSYIASRGPQGWSSHGISPPRGVAILSQGGTLDTQFWSFSDDLCMGWLVHDTDPPLAPGAVTGYANLYRADLCGEEGYEALSTVKPPTIPPLGFETEMQGRSQDGSHVIFRATDKLTSKGTVGKKQLYDFFAGELRLVCVLPNGAGTKQHCSAGTAGGIRGHSRSDAVTNAISEDGSRIFWTDAEGPGPIYVRINGFNPGSECSTPESPCTVAVGSGQFWAAAADGSVAIFTTPNGQLNEFVVDDKDTNPIAGDVAGVLGASEDASRIYFVSEEALAAGASAGEPNLYLHEAEEGGGGTYTFIATLSEVDARRLDDLRSPVNNESDRRPTRVSPDGLHVAFMSTASPTGYDNVDANSGEDDAEVFLYDATANEGAGQLRCVSCNPTGARPVGREVERYANNTLAYWAAAQIPGTVIELYAPRILSPDGQRLFFESFDSLVARDTNGAQDVYQWEAVGKGGCEEVHPDFNPNAEGCVSLISSGQSPRDSAFVDASPTGDDVFFTTGASLLAHDPGLIDIYDARVEGGFPPPPSPKPPCEGEACQSPPAPPDDPTPATVTSSGPGNVQAPKSRTKRCGKGQRKARRNGKARCVRKQKRHAKRTAAPNGKVGR
jgi:hypothetical protein